MRSKTFIAVLGFTTVALGALVILGWRSLDGFEATITRVLRAGSISTAEQLSQQVQRDLRAPIFDLLEQVDHNALRTFDVPRIAKTLQAASGTHFRLVDLYFTWSIDPGPDPELAGVPDEERVLFYSPNQYPIVHTEPSRGVAGRHGFRSNRGLAEILQRDALRWAAAERPFALSYVQFEGRSYQVIYHYLLGSPLAREIGPSRDRDVRVARAIEGFLADARNLREEYFTDLIAQWQLNAGNGATLPRIAVSIFDDGKREIARFGRPLGSAHDGHARFPLLFFDLDLLESLSPNRPQVYYLTIRTGYESGTIEAMARQETNLQRLAWVVVSCVAVVGITLTARGAVKEMQLSQRRSQFVSSISHEIRTPLAKIQLYTDTMMSGHANSQEKLEDYCGVISNQVDRLTSLVQGLLDFGKVEAGIKEYYMEEIDLRNVLRRTLEMFEYELRQGDQVTEVELPDAPVRVRGNAESLQQLFANLIGNALKYSFDERYLRVALRATEGHASVEVTDHGSGIPRSEQRRIFRKYYRVSSVAASVGGSGIGLAIVAQVARVHGGAVSVSQSSARGSTFVVTLPLVSPVVTDAEASA